MFQDADSNLISSGPLTIHNPQQHSQPRNEEDNTRLWTTTTTFGETNFHSADDIDDPNFGSSFMKWEETLTVPETSDSSRINFQHGKQPSLVDDIADNEVKPIFDDSTTWYPTQDLTHGIFGDNSIVADLDVHLDDESLMLANIQGSQNIYPVSPRENKTY